ncbi:MAG: Rieske 2Fe-2S domain-containing protein [Elusimicrobia bacterium]|nr:Rieske 2Fe-2S domain-containing protein [Elusimicrobiota bacterium]
MSGAKDGRSRRQNLATQPLKTFRVFTRPGVLTEGWYPLFPSRELKAGELRSAEILSQRLAVYRGADGVVRALDAFCPHMGADLANGSVEGAAVRCALHGWRFGPTGCLDSTPCGVRPASEPALASYAVEERYGFVWVFPSARPPYSVPVPAGLEGTELAWRHVGSFDLYAHQHVLMASGIDLQHFFSVHGVAADFGFSVEPLGPGRADWRVEGELTETGLMGAAARVAWGERLRYVARFSGGTVASLSYLAKAPWGPMYVLWGCTPLETGLSRVQVFLVCPRAQGALGAFREAARLALTQLLFLVLKRDDVKAFPNIRFQPGHLLRADACVARFIQWVEDLPVSRWTAGVEENART